MQQRARCASPPSPSRPIQSLPPNILQASLLLPTHTATILAPPGRGGLQHPPPDPLAFFSALWSVLPNASVVYPKNSLDPVDPLLTCVPWLAG